jgi:hypothetical protein
VAGGLVCLPLRTSAEGQEALSLHMLLNDFGIVRVDRGPVIALGLVVLVGGLIAGTWRRTPAMWVIGVTVLGGVVVAALVGEYEFVEKGKTLYFFEKSLHGVTVLLLVGLGGTAVAVQRLLRSMPAGGGRARTARAVTSVVAALSGTALLGGLDWTADTVGGIDPLPGVSWGRVYVSGSASLTTLAQSTLTTVRDVPDPQHKMTLVDDRDQMNNLSTLFVSVLQRDYGRSDAVVRRADGLIIGPDGVVNSLALSATPADAFATYLTQHPDVQLVSSDPDVLAKVTAELSLHPTPGVEVIDLRKLPQG